MVTNDSLDVDVVLPVFDEMVLHLCDGVDQTLGISAEFVQLFAPQHQLLVIFALIVQYFVNRFVVSFDCSQTLVKSIGDVHHWSAREPTLL